MDRINQYNVYELACAIHPVLEFSDDVSPATMLFRLFGARNAINQCLSSSPSVRLIIAKPAAEDVLRRIDELIDESFTAGSPGSLSIPDTVETWRYIGVREAMRNFEAVLRADMQRFATFAVPKRGIFDTDELVNAACATIPGTLQPAISSIALGDLDSAGRCLAFGLFTASGFHACRAVEAVMEDYYRRLCGATGTLNSWNDYDRIAKGPPPLPEASTVRHLDTMRKYNRNEIAHPRITLDEAEADMVFALAKAVICCMAKELLAIGIASVPAVVAPAQSQSGTGP